jgi:DNA-binding Lrp family transcriptional regulator
MIRFLSNMKQSEANKKVLRILLENARLPISKISKKTGLSREIVTYSIKKLEKEGVIKSYVARINQPFFCEGIASVFFKLIKTNKQRSKEIISYLKNHNSVNWVAELCGNADLVVTILYKNSEDLANTASEITKFIGSNLKENDVSLYITEYKFSRKGLIYEKEEQYKPITFRGKVKEISLDEKDALMLSELSKNCRIKNSELATLINLSEDMVRIRIKKLEDKGIILGYTLVIDTNALGFESYYVGLKIENMIKEVSDKIRYYVSTNPYITFAARTAGRYDVVFTISTKNRQHFRDILSDINNKLGENVLNYEFLLNIDEHKEIFVSEGFFK